MRVAELEVKPIARFLKASVVKVELYVMIETARSPAIEIQFYIYAGYKIEVKFETAIVIEADTKTGSGDAVLFRTKNFGNE